LTPHAFRLSPRRRPRRDVRLHLAAGRLLVAHRGARAQARWERCAGLPEDAARHEGRAAGIAAALREIELVATGER
jgi:hypothetical protein